MQRGSPPSQVLLFCAVLPVLLCSRPGEEDREREEEEITRLPWRGQCGRWGWCVVKGVKS
jgi:hypothetical protein